MIRRGPELFRLLLWGIAAAIPLIISPGYFFQFDITPKVVLLLAGACVAALHLVFLPHRWLVFSVRGERRWFATLIAAQAILLLAGIMLSADGLLSLGGSDWRRFGVPIRLAGLLVAAVVAVEVARRKQVIGFLRMAVTAGVMVSLYAMLQYCGWDPWIPTEAYTEGYRWRVVRPPGTMGHATYLAGYLVQIVFWALGLGAVEESRLARWLALVAALIASVAILLSGTRGAVLGMAAGAAVVIWFWPEVRKRRNLVAASAGLALVLVFVFSDAGINLRHRFVQSGQDAIGGPRLLVWKDALQMGARRALTGYGPEVFGREFTKFQSEGLAQAFPDSYHESPHNIVLDAFVEQGIPGLGILAMLVGLGLLSAWRIRATEPALSAMLAGSLVASITAHQFICFVPATALCFYVNIALLVGVAGGKRTDKPLPPGNTWRLVLAGIGALVAAGAAGLAMQHFLFERRMAQVKDAIDSGNIAQSVAIYLDARAWAPPGVSQALWCARQWMQHGALEPAIAAARDATVHADDRHNAHYFLAALYARQGDAVQTEHHLRLAIAAAPQWHTPHTALAELLRIAGHVEEAAREADIAGRLRHK